jgi:putative SOS response-associated peptidase YedK
MAPSLIRWPQTEIRFIMCGKFTAMASWAEVVAFSQPLTADRDHKGDNDHEITLRVMSNLPVIIWDKKASIRRVVPMRWGFPDTKNWRVPKPIHARAETIDTTKAFAAAFLEGQRGIVIVRTFNEAPNVPGPTVQHTIPPGDQSAIGIAFVWGYFVIPRQPGLLTACVMVTVPANELIATLPTDRMPAVLADEDWATWLGETGTPDDAKGCLKTVEGVKWTMTKEERAATSRPPRHDEFFPTRQVGDLDNLINRHNTLAKQCIAYWMDVLRWKSKSPYIGEPTITEGAHPWSTSIQNVDDGHRFWTQNIVLMGQGGKAVSSQEWAAAGCALKELTRPPVWSGFVFEARQRLGSSGFKGGKCQTKNFQSRFGEMHL